MSSLSSMSSVSSAEDDELTNLTWLQDCNLLQHLSQNSNASKNAAKELDTENVSPSPPLSAVKATGLDRNDASSDSNSPKESLGSDSLVTCAVPPVTYNPRVHVHTKPPYSFSSLIFMAIESSPSKALPVKDIYAWILDNFPYYQTAPDGWKNTVRHNLSLNKCFQKVEKTNVARKLANDSSDNMVGKGSLWCVDTFLRPNLLQAVKKIPAHIYPYMSTAKTGQNFLQISDTFSTTTEADTMISGANLNMDQTTPMSSVTLLNDASPATLDDVSSNQNGEQTPKKLITIDKSSSNKLLPLLSKRVLIPIAKVERESDEADVAESMLTLTQCNDTNINNGNIYIITNKSSDSLIPILSSNEIGEEGAIPLVPVNFHPSTEHNYFSRDSDQVCDQIVEEDGAVHDFTIQSDESMCTREPIHEVTIKAERKGGKTRAANSTEDNDDDGLKCAEALYNLANAGTIKASATSGQQKSAVKTRAKSKGPCLRSSKLDDKPASKKAKTT